MTRRTALWFFALSLAGGVACAQVASIDYHLVGVVREMPSDHAIVSDLSDGSSITWHEIVFEISKSNPPLQGGGVLRVRYQGNAPTIGAHTISVGDTILFTLKKGRDPGSIEWQDADARMQANYSLKRTAATGGRAIMRYAAAAAQLKRQASAPNLCTTRPMIPFEVRLSNFLGAVAFAADEEQQRAVWIEGAPGLTSITSIGEFYCQFFDDNDMDAFIENELSSSPLSAPQKAAVIEFRAALSPVEALQSYQEGNDRQTLETPQWRSLVRCAKNTLSVFES